MVINEKKRSKFKELAESRVNKTIDTIRLIGNLSRKSNYEYSQDDVLKIKRAIERELKVTWALFESGSDSSDGEKFKL